jgi:hypothetical protein
VDSHSARKLIEGCFPELRIKRCRQMRTGWENFVLEINGEYVFRFPKYWETEKRLENEIEFLPTLASRLSTQVPDYEFVWKATGSIHTGLAATARSPESRWKASNSERNG